MYGVFYTDTFVQETPFSDFTPEFEKIYFTLKPANTNLLHLKGLKLAFNQFDLALPCRISDT